MNYAGLILPLPGMSRKGITLIELLVAIIMLGVVGIGFASVGIFARYQTVSADRRSQILNEAAIAVESIAKKVRHSEGWEEEPAFVVDTDGEGVNIRKNDGVPSTVSSDFCRFEFEGNTLYYRDSPDSPTREVVARKIVEFSLRTVDPIDPATLNPQKPYALSIHVKTVYNPGASISYPDNPDATIDTTVICPSVSMG